MIGAAAPAAAGPADNTRCPPAFADSSQLEERGTKIERLGIGQIEGARLGLLGVEPRSVSLDAAQLRLSGVE